MLNLECNFFEIILKYEENIVLFVCMGESYDVCNFVGLNKVIVGFLYVKNSEGWNVI